MEFQAREKSTTKTVSKGAPKTATKSIPGTPVTYHFYEDWNNIDDYEVSGTWRIIRLLAYVRAISTDNPRLDMGYLWEQVREQSMLDNLDKDIFTAGLEYLEESLEAMAEFLREEYGHPKTETEAEELKGSRTKSVDVTIISGNELLRDVVVTFQ